MDAEEHGYELRKGQVKKKTEGLITAAQNQVLRKSSIKSLIDKQHIPQNSGYVGREGTVNIDLKIHFNQKMLFRLKNIYIYFS